MQIYRARLKEKKKTENLKVLTWREKKEEDEKKEKYREYWKIIKRDS